MTIPNILSLLRLFLVPVFVLATLRGAFEVAFGAFLLAAVTDALDGWVARKLGQVSKLGMILDPAADKLMMVSGYIVYTLEGVAAARFPPGVTFTVFARDISIVLVAALIFSRTGADSFPPTVTGKISTILQAVALGVTIAANTPLAFVADHLLLASHALVVALTLLSGFGYIRQWQLFLREPALAEGAGVRFYPSSETE